MKNNKNILVLFILLYLYIHIILLFLMGLLIINSTKNTDGKIINKYTNNKTEIIFPSGVIKELYEDDSY